MPSSYTSRVQSGEITEFKDFALTCARAFGALIHLRDDPLSADIPDAVPQENYHKGQISVAEAGLAELEAATDDEIRTMADAFNKRRAAYAKEANERCLIERRRYEAMLAKVDAWTPPTPDHEDMKRFMKSQIEDSIKFDCHEMAEPTPVSATDWLNERRTTLQRELDYHRKNAAEEETRNAGRTAWIKALKESLMMTVEKKP